MENIERQKLISEIEEARQNLIKYGRELENHLIIAHHGFPASTCHRCRSFQQGIQSNGRLIRDNLRDLGLSDFN